MTTPFTDAQAALGFVTAQTSYIERQVNEIVYPDIMYPTLVPIDNSAPEWIKSVTYFSSDKFGRANWINGNADDIPRAGTARTKYETEVHMAGIGYGYGLEEINQARLLGIPLEAEDAMAARRAYEEMMERVAMTGDTAKNFTGLLNGTGVPVSSNISGKLWSAATPQEILGDINGAIIGQFSGTQYTSMADTVLLPYTRFLSLGSRMVSNDSTVSILNWLLQNNVYTVQTGRALTVRGVRQLETAGSGGVPRMVAYRRDPMVVKMHVPMPHRFLPAFQAGPMRVEVPGIFRLGGVDWRRPKEACYVDGI
jgi:hypothetical protein